MQQPIYSVKQPCKFGTGINVPTGQVRKPRHGEGLHKITEQVSCCQTLGVTGYPLAPRADGGGYENGILSQKTSKRTVARREMLKTGYLGSQGLKENGYLFFVCFNENSRMTHSSPM